LLEPKTNRGPPTLLQFRKLIVLLLPSRSANTNLPPASLPTKRALVSSMAMTIEASILLQILACALYNNWWPMLSALMYVLVPMPCLFFGGGSTQFLLSRESDGWVNAAKFLTGASTLMIPVQIRWKRGKNNIRHGYEDVKKFSQS
ncbi:Vacuolar protein sorting 55 family protein, partial [Prunus dulcis]